MTSPGKDYTIRFVKETDLESLRRFFVKAYGKYTVFQNSGFLNWYFNQKSDRNAFMKSCVIAVNNNDEVVSHYGGLSYTLMLHDNPVSIVWGVNAYTLPEWRKLGINSKLFIEMINRHDMLGVIGMPFNAPAFYQNLGFNIFNKQTLNRYVLILDVKTFEVVKTIKQDVNQAKKLFDVILYDYYNVSKEKGNNVIQISKENFNKFTVDFDYKISATTQRDINYLKWRFIDNPYIDYRLIAYISENKILAYAAVRRERLNPTNYYATRMVDLYGNDNFISKIIKEIVLHAKINNDIFVDFCAFGIKYQTNLTDLGFTRLQNENVSLLPQVTSPIENRPNHEFIVLFSNKYKNEIEKLTEEEVFFTRADADRDRITNINQI